MVLRDSVVRRGGPSGAFHGVGGSTAIDRRAGTAIRATLVQRLCWLAPCRGSTPGRCFGANLMFVSSLENRFRRVVAIPLPAGLAAVAVAPFAGGRTADRWPASVSSPARSFPVLGFLMCILFVTLRRDHFQYLASWGSSFRPLPADAFGRADSPGRLPHRPACSSTDDTRRRHLAAERHISRLRNALPRDAWHATPAARFSTAIWG